MGASEFFSVGAETQSDAQPHGEHVFLKRLMDE